MNEWEWQLLEDRVTPTAVTIGGVELKKGDLVRLRPRAGGDIFDIALAGQAAIIESIEQDYEGRTHLAVILEHDPGKDLGALRQPGHRFFFTADEVEPLARAPKILIAGIGNIFLGDDGFGVEVIRRLSGLSGAATIRDFGIRGYDLAYALLDDYDVAILIDAVPRGCTPGTLFVIEPDLDAKPPISTPDPHAMNPMSVLQLAQSMGPVTCRVLLVGCEPADLGGDEGKMELSPAVAGVVDEAARIVETLVQKTIEGGGTVEVSNSPERKQI